MPRYGVWIGHACGHRVHCDFSQQPPAEEIRYRSRQACPACAAQVRLPGTDPLPNLPAEAPLPDLQGSAKQIGWAMDIRPRKLAEVARHLVEWRRLIEAHRDPEKQERAREKLRAAMEAGERLEQITSAHWWIEHRELTAAELLAEAGGLHEPAR